jgi:CBS domain-containing protein
MATAGQLIRERAEAGESVHTIAPDATVLEAVRRMNDRRIGSLVVVDGAGRALGIFTERDLLKRVVSEGLDPKSTRVEQVMTGDVIVCTPDTHLDAIRQTMRERRIRHMPIIEDDGSLVGMISIGDLNVAEVKVMSETIAYLEQYMTRL